MPDQFDRTAQEIARPIRGCATDEQYTEVVGRIAAALRSAPVPPGWQPMESAPKDGTHILVCFGDRPYDEHWTFAQSPPTVAHWFGPPDLPGIRAGGWYLSVQQHEGERVHPSQWLPLPPLPTKPEGE